MAAVQKNITETVTINSQTAKATGIRKLVKNNTGADIDKFKPIINGGWDTDEDCMLVKLPDSKNDIVIGVTVEKIRDNTVVPAQYVSSGMVLNVDTSAWAANEFIYAKTDGSFTNDPYADVVNTIPQEIGLVIRSHATKGEVFVSAIGSQVKYIKLAMSLIEAESADTGSDSDGDTIHLLAGDGDDTGDGGDVILQPGEGGTTGADGKVKVRQAGTAEVDAKEIELEHDGTDAIIKSLTGMLKAIGTKLRADDGSGNYVELWADGTLFYIDSSSAKLNTNNKQIDIGTAIYEGANIQLDDLTGGQIVEVDAGTGNLTSVAKATAYNKAFGTSSGQVAEGDHNHDADYHPLIASTFTGNRTWTDATNTHDVTVDNGIITAWTITPL